MGFVLSTEAQTVVVQKNEITTKQTQDPNIFYINGIPSTQDIGGVDIQTGGETDEGNSKRYAQFKNYNSVVVTVLYNITTETEVTQAGYPAGSIKKQYTGSIVLKPNEERIIPSGFCSKIIVATITRKLQ